MSPDGPGGAGRPRVVVVGGGVSGLTAALRLAERGVRVEVREAAAQPGGILRRAEVGGLVLDTGAESFLARRPEGVALAREVGLGDDVVHPRTTRARVLTPDGPRPLPGGTLMGVPGTGEAVRGVLGPAEVRRVEQEEELPAPAVSEDLSVAEYVAARVGPAVVDRLVEPLLGGVYAGHAARLSLQATVPALWTHARAGGSLLAAVRAAAGRTAPGATPAPVFGGIRGGVARLAEALAGALAARDVEVRTATPVRSLRRVEGGWVVDGDRVDGVLLAVPAPVAARLLTGAVPSAAQALAEVETASVVVVAFTVPAADLRGWEDASGLLVPPALGRAAGRRVKAVTLSSHKWGWVGEQAPDRRVLRVSLGRAGETDVPGWDDDRLRERALQDARALLGARLDPDDALVQRWPDALPQYAVGHLDRVQRVRAAAGAAGRIALAGSFADGVGVPACVATAARAVEELLPQLLRPDAPLDGREHLR
ncbi:protoporphyrinogen oxidase [Kineococcus gynurae]|uniref:Coproporphyrinogen III oxidase n=1 Tax=Kineococcus gynurae TaxID=452979 RepID=A0ABV5LUZ5_9ACTN